jgi:hypothetical protein
MSEKNITIKTTIGPSLFSIFGKGKSTGTSLTDELNNVDKKKTSLHDELLKLSGKNDTRQKRTSIVNMIIKMNNLDHYKRQLIDDYVNPVYPSQEPFVKKKDLNRVSKTGLFPSQKGTRSHIRSDVRGDIRGDIGTGSEIENKMNPVDYRFLMQKRFEYIKDELIARWDSIKTPSETDFNLFSSFIKSNIPLPSKIKEKMHKLQTEYEKSTHSSILSNLLLVIKENNKELKDNPDNEHIKELKKYCKETIDGSNTDKEIFSKCNQILTYLH